MSLLDRLFRLIKGPPDCVECGRYDPRSMHGSWWHEEWCSANQPRRTGGSDDE